MVVFLALVYFSQLALLKLIVLVNMNDISSWIRRGQIAFFTSNHKQMKRDNWPVAANSLAMYRSSNSIEYVYIHPI